MGADAVLFDDWRDMLVEMQRAGADFLVVGAFALSAHGYTRATKDIDLFIRPSVENAPRVVAALARFGAPLHGVTARDLAEPGLILQLGVPPRRIDLLTSIDGVSFDEASSERIVVDVAGLRVPVIGRAALVANKRAAGRPQDRVDVRALTAAGRGPAARSLGATKRRATKQRATKQSATKQSATKQSATKQSASKQSASKQSASKQSATKQRTAKQPGTATAKPTRRR